MLIVIVWLSANTFGNWIYSNASCIIFIVLLVKSLWRIPAKIISLYFPECVRHRDILTVGLEWIFISSEIRNVNGLKVIINNKNDINSRMFPFISSKQYSLSMTHWLYCSNFIIMTRIFITTSHIVQWLRVFIWKALKLRTITLLTVSLQWQLL